MAVQSDMERYELGPCIGRGSYGDVFKGVDTATGKQVAFKIIDLEEVDDDIESIHKEISMLAGCQCKNITEFYSAVLRPGSAELMIVMELMSCSVADLLAHGPLDEESIAHILREVLQALLYLHSERRIHRDVKAANVLLNAAGDVKISDFGVSGQLTGTMGFSRKTFVGTPFWMAPEVIDSASTSSSGGDGYKESADIWSLGITAIEMATGAPPHAELHAMRVLFLIPKCPPPRLEGNFSDVFKDFVAQCLQKDPSARPSARELLNHPFVAAATSPPSTLGGMAEELAKRRQPLKSRRDMAEDWVASGGTLPGWDFGTRKAGRGATLRIGDTFRGPNLAERVSVMGTLKAPAQASAPTSATVDPQPPAALAAEPAVSTLSTTTAAAHLTTASTARPTANGATESAPSTSSQQEPVRGTLIGYESGGGAAVPVTAASTRYAAATQQTSSGESSGDTYATVRVADPDKYGTVQSKRGSDTYLTPRPGATEEGPQADDLTRTTSMRRTTTLQVEIQNPATASPELHQQLQQQQHASAGQRHHKAAPSQHSKGGAPGASSQAESAALLSHVVGPALDTLCAALGQQASQPSVQQQPAGTATQSQALLGFKSHIHQLERQFPGTCASLVHELLAHLAATTQPALAPTQAAATTLLAPCADKFARTMHVHTSSSTLKGSQSDYQAALAAATGKPPLAHTPSTGSLHASASAGAGLDQQQTAQATLANGHSAPKPGGTFLPPRQVPQLGALGEFLLGKWQLEEARGRSLLARTGALG